MAPFFAAKRLQRQGFEMKDRSLDASAARARESDVVVAYAAPRVSDAREYRRAYVVGADGALLTTHDQLSASPPIAAGGSLSSMW